MKTQASHDLYTVLGVRPDADPATIRWAYRACVRHAHPDRRPPADAPRAHEEMALINLAYETLSDPFKRAEYDAKRWATTSGQAAAPPPPHVVVVTPETVDFGTVYICGEPVPREVSLRFADGSRIADARVMSMFGDCWYTGATVFRDVPTVDFRIFGVASSPNRALGLHVDQLGIQVDEVTVCVQLHITVEAAPPAPEPAPDITRPRRPSRAALGLWVALIVVVAVIAGALIHVSGQSHHQAAPSRPAPQRAATEAPPSTYCSVAWPGGQVVSYYLNEPGVAKQAAAGLAPIWSTGAPGWSDQWVDWLTPGFPYWEEANAKDGFSLDGQTYGRFQYVEVAPYQNSPWMPRAEAFRQYPHLNAAAETAQRTLFIREWSKELGSPPCS